ncbi:imidazole glycerol phosphate synthase subunit HisH [Virgibacillus chiguensis]|uniref:Imidazole glycerol phosphate synthase subunit HisH n=1 Tax=Virgibacillus chiguensis TaxID=411959 RepID=A0A1M5QFQ2_9BACI|nr:imidazole glycerol phosphate synthase subunit HisH [Virgibacillus chiguensis]SHH12579.1 glutamine amidotransferase [Virgibacillus chiguensis]
MISIIDYGAGNIKSLQFALNKVGIDSQITTDETTIKKSDAIILPGVGAFQDAMHALDDQELTSFIKQEAARGKPLLGICLGMQLFYESSEEGGVTKGFGFLTGKVKKIPNNVKVPHMGWNNLIKHRNSALWKQMTDEAFVYFVHSYAATDVDTNTLVASTPYGINIPAIVQQNNIIGMQFHPEKSGATGLQLLANFKEMIT